MSVSVSSQVLHHNTAVQCVNSINHCYRFVDSWPVKSSVGELRGEAAVDVRHTLSNRILATI